MADTTPEGETVLSGTGNGQDVTTAEILEGFESPPPSAAEEAIEALGTDIFELRSKIKKMTDQFFILVLVNSFLASNNS